MRSFIPIEDQPPSMQIVSYTVRDQMLRSLAQAEAQRAQQEAMQQRMALKMKRRIRKHRKGR